MEKYLEKIIEKSKEAISTITQKTDELIDYSKHKIKKSSLDSELGKVYAKLGKVVYDSKKSGDDESVLISLVVSEIDAINKSIDDLVADSEALKQSKKYNSAGYEAVVEDPHEVKIQPVETVDFIPEVSDKIEDISSKGSDASLEDIIE